MEDHEPTFSPGERLMAKWDRAISDSAMGLRGCALRQPAKKTKIPQEVKTFLTGRGNSIDFTKIIGAVFWIFLCGQQMFFCNII